MLINFGNLDLWIRMEDKAYIDQLLLFWYLQGVKKNDNTLKMQ